MAYRARVIASGSYLPQRILTNAELATQVETDDAWIRQRTGICQRHIAADDELTSDLGIAAARKALDAAGLSGQDIDLVVCATATPDETFPATATRVQAALGMTSGAAFDVQAVCSGFIYALAVADNFIRAGQARRVLVVAAEVFSRILDWSDRTTCVLFGDGAGAVILEAQALNGSAERNSAARGLLSTHLYSDGQHHDALYVDGGPGSTQTTGFLRMQGREVFKHAVTRMAEAIDVALDANDLTPGDVDWMVPHQANVRIIEAMAKKLNLPMDQVIVTVDRHANTSAASIPLALDAAVTDGRVKTNDLLLLEAMGGGFTWGSALIRW
ncbi:MAG: beta-ketoacyl-ACP synthase III [Pseudomonadota bacterium]